jgi:hypothetical protein
VSRISGGPPGRRPRCCGGAAAHRSARRAYPSPGKRPEPSCVAVCGAPAGRALTTSPPNCTMPVRVPRCVNSDEG